jgi:hypothetical protein
MKRISAFLALVLVGTLSGFADAAPKPQVRLSSERGSPPAGCAPEPTEGETCLRIIVEIRNYIPNLSQTEDVQADFASHATRNGPAVTSRVTSYHTDSEGNAILQFGGIICEEDAPWYSFDPLEPEPVESKVHKAC